MLRVIFFTDLRYLKPTHADYYWLGHVAAAADDLWILVESPDDTEAVVDDDVEGDEEDGDHPHLDYGVGAS